MQSNLDPQAKPGKLNNYYSNKQLKYKVPTRKKGEKRELSSTVQYELKNKEKEIIKQVDKFS